MDNKENYYELLKVSPKASVSEIVSAYHAAKNAFSSDSIASYSLLDSEESKEIIKKIEFRFSVIDKMEQIVNQSAIKSELLRKSILKSAFEGNLVNFEVN
jgi:hypothetical protein